MKTSNYFSRHQFELVIEGKNDVGATVTGSQRCFYWHDGDLDYCNSEVPKKYRIDPYGKFEKRLTVLFSEFPGYGSDNPGEVTYAYWGSDDNGNDFFLETRLHVH